MSNLHNSGDGSRPTTDGGVDNLGAGKAFDPRKPNNDSPSHERAPIPKTDKPATRGDDSAPLGLRDSPETTPNTEPPETAIDNNSEGR